MWFAFLACVLLTAESAPVLPPRGKKAALQPTPAAVISETGAPWNYSDIEEWHNSFPECAGHAQSPINLRFKNFPHNSKVDHLRLRYSPSNSTVAFSSFSLRAFFTSLNNTLQAEHLPNKTYVLTQIHFHWDTVDTAGSEHRLNGKQYPLEMHMVHYLSSCGSQASCSSVEGGLTVLGVMFDIGAPSPDLQLMLDAVSVGRVDNFPPGRFLPKNARSEFVHYTGSLTTPPCTEGVNWIIATEIGTVSEEQINMLRNMLDVRTWRDPQPEDSSRPIETSWNVPVGKGKKGKVKVGPRKGKA